MFKDNRYINAGTNEIYRYGHKAQEKALAYLEPNDKGYYSFPVDGGNYWTIGTSEGKYGEFCKYCDNFLSVNKGGYMYAKEGTEKAEVFKEFVGAIVNEMKKINAERLAYINANEED